MRYFAKPNAIRFKENVVFCETQRISLPEKCFVLRNPSHFSSRNMPCFAKPNTFLFKDNAYVLRNPTQPFKNSFQKASNLGSYGHKPKKPGRIWGGSKTAQARKPNALEYLLWPKNEVLLIEREISAWLFLPLFVPLFAVDLRASETVNIKCWKLLSDFNPL